MCNGEIMHQEENSNKQTHKINMTEAENAAMGWAGMNVMIEEYGFWWSEFIVEIAHTHIRLLTVASN